MLFVTFFFLSLSTSRSQMWFGKLVVLPLRNLVSPAWVGLVTLAELDLSSSVGCPARKKESLFKISEKSGGNDRLAGRGRMLCLPFG